MSMYEFFGRLVLTSQRDGFQKAIHSTENASSRVLWDSPCSLCFPGFTAG
jgi:hypothetical protein